jgi:hypothetical protein
LRLRKIEGGVYHVDSGYACAYSAVERLHAGPNLHRELSLKLLEID